MVDPLNATVPIVDAKGFPTLEFMRKWAQQSALNATLAAGVAPASPGIASQFLAGTSPPTWQYIKDSDIAFTDILTNNVSVSKHGFAPKSSGSAAQFLNGLGAYTTPTTSLGALTDVDTTGLTSGKVLEYNGTKWVPWTPLLSADGDVAIASPLNQQLLQYNSGTGKWTNATVTITTTLAALTDVQLASLSNGQYLQYDSVAGKWKNVTLSVTSTLAGLTDVQLAALADKNHLQYDNAAGKWKNVAAPALATLTDVDTTGLTSGNFFKYNGTKWVPTAAPAVSNLTDVDLTGLAASNLIQWNGTKWVPVAAGGVGVTTLSALSDVTISSPAAGDLLRYNGGTSKWNNYAQRKISWPVGSFSSNNTGLFACKGNLFFLTKNIIIDRIMCVLNGTNTHVIGAFIGNVTGSGNAATIASTLVTATPVTLGSTAWQTVELTVAPTTLTAGSSYVVCVVDKSNATTTTSINIGAVSNVSYDNMPVDMGLMLKTWTTTGASSQFAQYATLSDAPAALSVGGVGAGYFPIGMRWYDA